MPHLANQPLVAQRRNDAVGVDAPDGPHAFARHRLVVRDDRKRLEGRLREVAGVPGENVLLDRLVVGGVREEPPAAGGLAQLDATVCALVLSGEVGERSRHLSGCHAQDLREVGCRNGVGRDEEKGFEHALERLAVNVIEVKH